MVYFGDVKNRKKLDRINNIMIVLIAKSIRPWNDLPKEVLEAPSLGMFTLDWTQALQICCSERSYTVTEMD